MSHAAARERKHLDTRALCVVTVIHQGHQVTHQKYNPNKCLKLNKRLLSVRNELFIAHVSRHLPITSFCTNTNVSKGEILAGEDGFQGGLGNSHIY
jgi:hypothetical protein